MKTAPSRARRARSEPRQPGAIPGLPGVPDFTAAGQAYMNAIGEYQEELRDFFGRRLSNDLEFGQNLAACAGMGEAAAMQRQWASQALQDYVSESQKLMQIVSAAFVAPAGLAGKQDD